MPLNLSNPLLSLRPITSADEEVLCRIYSSVREEELRVVDDWTTAQKAAFLRAQFELQHLYYQKNYPGAYFWVMVLGGQVIGRLYLHPAYERNSVRIIDISLLPEWRNQGIGGQILSDILAFAASRGRSVTVHVECFNPAMRLYERLGFELVDRTNGVYYLLERKTEQTILL